MKSVVSCTQLNVFHAGDKVRLYRVIDGRRRVEGPFEVDHRDPKNCYLYFLKGRKFPAPLSHLLPYYEDDAEKKREDETGPHRAHLSSMLRGQMPLGITLADLRGGEWLVIRQLTTVDGGPTICYMAEFKRREGEKFLVGCLDRTASGKWVLPRSDDTDETVSAEDILGEQGFHPTRTRRIPPRVTEWLESHGISHVRH